MEVVPGQALQAILVLDVGTLSGLAYSLQDHEALKTGHAGLVVGTVLAAIGRSAQSFPRDKPTVAD